MSTQPSVAGVPGLDPTLPNVVLRLGGVDRHLVYDHNAIALAEKETGINLLFHALTSFNANTLRALLWSALVHELPELTIDDVGRMITPHNFAVIAEALRTAWFGSAPEPDKDASAGEAQGQVAPTA